MAVSVALLIFTVFVLICCNVYLFKQVDKLYDLATKQALKAGEHEHMLVLHDEKIKKNDYDISEIQAKLAEIPVEDIRAQQEAEKAWNDGVQSIINFGIDTMKKDGNS